MIKIKYLLIILSVFALSCQEEESNQPRKSISLNTHNVWQNDSTAILLGDTIKQRSNSIDYHNSNSPHLTYIPNDVSTIFLYDILQQKVIQKIPLQIEGPNGLGAGQLGVQFVNKDTIIIGNMNFLVAIINSKGEVIYKRSFSKDIGNIKEGQPTVETTKKAVLYNNKIYLNAHAYLDASKLEDFEDFPCLYELDLKTDKIATVFNLPTTYYTKGLYGANYASSFNTYNSKTKEFVWSFRNDPNVYTYSLVTKKTKAFHAPSKDFDEIPPMSKGLDASDLKTYFKFWTKSNSYGPIYYDEFKDVYYRFAEKAVDDIRYKEKKLWKFTSLMVMNKDFQKIGEIDMEDGFNNKECFVTPKSFFIRKYDKKNDKNLFIGFNAVSKK